MGICNRLTQKIRISHFIALNFATHARSRRRSICHRDRTHLPPTVLIATVPMSRKVNFALTGGTLRRQFRRTGGSTGQAKTSYLLKLVRHELPGLEMPPDGTLTKEDIAKLEIWIQEGAKTPEHYGPAKTETELKHWSFLPLRPTGNTSIDQLIADTLKSNGLQHSTQADRRKLIRRLYLVMLGIPPEPDQVTGPSRTSATAWQDLVSGLPARNMENAGVATG